MGYRNKQIKLLKGLSTAIRPETFEEVHRTAVMLHRMSRKYGGVVRTCMDSRMRYRGRKIRRYFKPSRSMSNRDWPWFREDYRKFPGCMRAVVISKVRWGIGWAR